MDLAAFLVTVGSILLSALIIFIVLTILNIIASSRHLY